MIASCQRHGVKPFAYLCDVLARIPEHLQSRIEDLLPGRWQLKTPRAPVTVHPAQGGVPIVGEKEMAYPVGS